MSLRNLPTAKTFDRPKGFAWDAPAVALERWAAAPVAADGQTADEITIYDVIGEDYWTGGGFTAKRMAAALRQIGEKPVNVVINSPGGDMFDGLAIYNMLRDHKQAVTVKVMGYAASAASVIAMAGDRIEMGLGSFLMIHNAWGAVVGNRHDFTDAADVFASFDGAMADIYEARTGADRKKIEKMMDAESWISASEAKALGMADAIVDQPEQAENGSARADVGARRRLDAILAKSGLPRSERRELLREAVGKPGAAEPHKPGAVDDGLMAGLSQLISTMKSN
jgi:ATP-dependent Clp protease, protease subunit